MAKTREITRQAPKEEKPTVNDIASMTEDEKELFFEVIKGAIAAINANSSLGAIGRQERLFKAHTQTALELATMFVTQYREMKNG